MNKDTVIHNKTIDIRLSFLKTLLRKQYAIPPEKGAWTWWIGPLLIGIAAAGNISIDILPLSIAALLSFLLRQPLTLFMITLSKGRNYRNLVPAAAWLAIYSFLLAICVSFLLSRGNTWILWLAALVLPIIIWHQRLVVRGEKRHQPLLDQAVAAISALMAPAAYWACQGTELAAPWFLWLLTWLQTSASIVHMFLRLEQRLLKQMPPLQKRWSMGILPLIFHSCNFLLSVWMVKMSFVPASVAVAFSVPLAEGFGSTIYPSIGATPRQLGMHQLGVNTIFILLMMV